MKFSSSPVFGLLAIVLFVPFMSGCGGGSTSSRPVGTITGKVTLAGKPLDAGRVIFAHVEGPSAVAHIQKDGTYSVEAAIGQTEVSIDHRAPAAEVPGGRPGMALPGKSLVPEKYAASRTSGLKLDVKTGKNTFDIAME